MKFYKRYASYLGIFVLLCFSFFYTEKAVEIIRKNDPVMKQIEQEASKYEVDPVNAYIFGDEISPGLNGKKVNIEKSYQDMKKINQYRSSMLVFDEVTPTTPLEEQYDKYVIQGNSSKSQVALIFKIDDVSYLDQLVSILGEKEVVATFFMDGEFVEQNMDKVAKLSNSGYEIENLGYAGKYSVDKFQWTNNMITSLTKKNTNYCYTDYKDSNILDLCSKNSMHTIKPTIATGSYPFLSVKKNLENGSLISFNLTETTLKELPSIISYIRQKGYDIVTIGDAISEKRNEDK
ncbi:MAG: polysaccharide deacetylase family protein [Bacilli bacterium]|nr:polysaccharide deacetylase family protein [Bacilli bacterium]